MLGALDGKKSLIAVLLITLLSEGKTLTLKIVIATQATTMR
jgi:hypothetical protein